MMNIDDYGKVYWEIFKMRAQLRERHADDWEAFRLDVRALQSACSHLRTTYHPDASGNNDSWTECLECGAPV